MLNNAGGMLFPHRIKKGGMEGGIFWFRNDLRLRDNPALAEAVEQCDLLLPVYVLDERLLERDRWGFRRMGSYRLQFLLESLEDLREQLRDKGSALLFRIGKPEETLTALAEAYDCSAVFATKAYAYEELQQEKALSTKIKTVFRHGLTLIHPDDTPFNPERLPDVFTAFRKKVERYSEVRRPLDSPEKIITPDLPDTPLPCPESLGYRLPPQDERAALNFQGGAKAAQERLDHYFWNTHSISTYKETRNGLIGAAYSTKFSPWLADGSLSPRMIYHQVEAYEEEIKKNKSTYWVKFELLWRDFFKYVAMRYGRRIFLRGGIQKREKEWQDNPKQFERWATGTTGDRFVDANMRELLRTGFMSNRGRQNVASYLVHQLQEDWRKGAAWFESLLIDYDPASNYGNWMYQAGVGNDPRDRVFNTKKQADRYDPDGQYRDLWLEQEPGDPVEFADTYFLGNSEEVK